jgi:nuclear transcription Y subunit beta
LADRPGRRASDKCQREKRKTINGDDLLWAMSTLGFEEYVEPLRVYLQKYREARARARPRGALRRGRPDADASTRRLLRFAASRVARSADRGAFGAPPHARSPL